MDETPHYLQSAQAKPFHLCHPVKEGIEGGGHFHLDHCFSLSVKGTYITPIRGFILVLPSSILSYCSSIWFPPAGPTGRISLPPGFSWSKSCGSGRRRVRTGSGCRGNRPGVQVRPDSHEPISARRANVSQVLRTANVPNQLGPHAMVGGGGDPPLAGRWARLPPREWHRKAPPPDGRAARRPLQHTGTE